MIRSWLIPSTGDTAFAFYNPAFDGSRPTSSEAINSSVLVLNRFYQAVHIINVRRAFALLFRDLAEVIHIDPGGQYSNYNFESWREISVLKSQFKEPHEDWIRSVQFEIQVPRVVRLLGYDRLPKQVVRFNRRNLFARDSNRCQYCGKRFPTVELSLDHVVPRSRGGQHTWENLAAACKPCNLRKRDLQTDTPYNTYTRPGLPPTPIALPGLASLNAALHPAASKALYFVARGDGSSKFSDSLAEHERAVTKYQRRGNR